MKYTGSLDLDFRILARTLKRIQKHVYWRLVASNLQRKLNAFGRSFIAALRNMHYIIFSKRIERMSCIERAC